jgi:hypothetical protein
LRIGGELHPCSNDIVGNWRDVFEGAIFELNLGGCKRCLNASSDIPEVLRLKVSLHRMLPVMVVGAVKDRNQGDKSVRHSSRE